MSAAPMTRADFTALLARKGIPFAVKGDALIVGEGWSGNVDLFSLTALPEGTVFSNGGYVDLPSLTALPEGTVFSNGGYVDLPSLTAETQSYQGRKIRLRFVDGYTMLIVSERTKGEYRIARARYFGGSDLDKLCPCYIATLGDYTAHGETVAEAMADVRFKVAQVNYDAAELVERVKSQGWIAREDFRLLTGACSEGLRAGLVDLGQPADLDRMALPVALEMVRGRYGADAMYRAFGESSK